MRLWTCLAISTATAALPFAISCRTCARSLGGTSASGASRTGARKGFQSLKLFSRDILPACENNLFLAVARGRVPKNCIATPAISRTSHPSHSIAFTRAPTEYNRTSHRAHFLATPSRVSGAPHALQNHPRRSPVHLRHSTGGLRRHRFGQQPPLPDRRRHDGHSAGQRSGQPLVPGRLGTRFPGAGAHPGRTQRAGPPL